VTLYLGYLIGCDYFIWCVSCTVVVLTCFVICVCVGFVMCESFDNCVGVLVICVLVYTVLYCLYCVFVLFRLCIFILICY
jgi:hypothetical protein